MSEKQIQVEKERRGVLEILLKKNGFKRKELVDFLLGVWMAGNKGVGKITLPRRRKLYSAYELSLRDLDEGRAGGSDEGRKYFFN